MSSIWFKISRSMDYITDVCVTKIYWILDIKLGKKLFLLFQVSFIVIIFT